MSQALIQTYRELSSRVDKLRFSPPVARVYNPLTYARAPFEAYLSIYGAGKKRVLLMGMNPGPFGMTQTGVPFGDVVMVSKWMGITSEVRRPANPHPKRPIDGFSCTRREVSGTRLWTWAAERFGSPKHFFADWFVINYCPLVFMDDGGKNRTPDKLAKKERSALFESCDVALREVARVLKPSFAIGIGTFAEKQLINALDPSIAKGRILHPSPASPAANRGWAVQVEQQLRDLGVLD